jgi:hypothetical protein
LGVFGILQILDKTENKVKEMKGETLKMYRAIAAFYKATIIPMVRWSFIRAGLFLKLDDLFGPLTVNPAAVIDRIALPEIAIEHFVAPETTRSPLSTDRSVRRRDQIPGPIEFAVSLRAYIDNVSGTCPLCGHSEEEESSDDAESTSEYIVPPMILQCSDANDPVLNGSVSSQLLFFCDDYYFRTDL